MKSIKIIILLAVSMFAVGAIAQQNPQPPQGGGEGRRGPMNRLAFTIAPTTSASVELHAVTIRPFRKPSRKS